VSSGVAPSDRIHFAGRDAATTWQSHIEGVIESGVVPHGENHGMQSERV